MFNLFNDKYFYGIELKVKIIASVIMFAFLFSSCDGGISEKKFIVIYTDILIAQDTLGTDLETMKKIREGIYAKYKITDKDYLATLDRYNKNPKDWTIFFDKVTEYLESEKKKIK